MKLRYHLVSRYRFLALLSSFLALSCDWSDCTIAISWFFENWFAVSNLKTHARHYLVFVFSLWSCSLDCVGKICFFNHQKTPKTDGNMWLSRIKIKATAAPWWFELATLYCQPWSELSESEMRIKTSFIFQQLDFFKIFIFFFDPHFQCKKKCSILSTAIVRKTTFPVDWCAQIDFLIFLKKIKTQ